MFLNFNPRCSQSTYFSSKPCSNRTSPSDFWFFCLARKLFLKKMLVATNQSVKHVCMELGPNSQYFIAFNCNFERWYSDHFGHDSDSFQKTPFLMILSLSILTTPLSKFDVVWNSPPKIVPHNIKNNENFNSHCSHSAKKRDVYWTTNHVSACEHLQERGRGEVNLSPGVSRIERF